MPAKKERVLHEFLDAYKINREGITDGVNPFKLRALCGTLIRHGGFAGPVEDDHGSQIGVREVTCKSCIAVKKSKSYRRRNSIVDETQTILLKRAPHV